MSLMATTGNVMSFSRATPSGVLNSASEVYHRQLHSIRHKVHVDFERFYGVEPARVDRDFDLTLSDFSFLPKVGLLASFNIRCIR